MAERKQQIAENLLKIKNQLKGNTQLLAVSKTYPIEDIIFAYESGQRHFGENKGQDLLQKSAELLTLCPEIKWHFIGQIQSNKIPLLIRVPNLYAVHSISSPKLVDKIIKYKTDFPKELKLFLQLNSSGESEKAGFDTGDELIQYAKRLHKEFNFSGIMTLGTIRTDQFESEAARCFKECSELKNKIEKELGISGLELSMGMSSDLEIALEYESDWVRVGTGIFGARV